MYSRKMGGYKPPIFNLSYNLIVILFLRQLRSFILPFTMAIVVPFLLLVSFNPLRFKGAFPFPYLQIPFGAVLFSLGSYLLVVTIRFFIQIGKGTLAPWDPTQKLVVAGIYCHVRNPMISGVLLMILGETILFASWALLGWAVVFMIINSIYFKMFEEPGLVSRFGDEYVLYRANVPMWIPRLKPWNPKNSS
jgi:protein-S-isoprenylcysteine O-methyltransferase Ste14